LLTQPAPSRRQFAGAGALLALAFVVRLQYAPAIAVLVAGACWRQWSRLLPLTLGGSIVLVVAGAIDAMNGALPFAWVVANVQLNLLHGRAEGYGVQPLAAYVGSFAIVWSVAIVPLAFAIGQGARRAPLLLWVAVANIAVHSLIGHKEYRFIFLSVVLLVLLAALGSADWIVRLRSRAGWRRRAAPLIVAAWALVSGALALSGQFPEYWTRGLGAAELAGELRRDPAVCGVALYETPFFLLVERARLSGRAPIYALDAKDPLVHGATSEAARRTQSSFNRIVARKFMAPDLPANFVQGRCAVVAEEPVCLFARSGPCEAASATPFKVNDVLIRLDL
jgi:hypothetical protein